MITGYQLPEEVDNTFSNFILKQSDWSVYYRHDRNSYIIYNYNYKYKISTLYASITHFWTIQRIEREERVAFVGLSNWALDPAKMNRGIMVTRGDPDITDLLESAE